MPAEPWRTKSGRGRPLGSALLTAVLTLASFISAVGGFINGEPVKQPLPWMVHITLTYSHTRINCGGGLVSPRHVLSAAHCFCHERDPSSGLVTMQKTVSCRMAERGSEKVAANFSRDEIVLLLGSVDLGEAIRRTPSRVAVHPYYQNEFEPASFDIAVVELFGADLRMGRGSRFGSLLLPTRRTHDLGVSVESAGWGIKRRRHLDSDRASSSSDSSVAAFDTCRTSQYGPSKFRPCEPMLTYYCDQRTPPPGGRDPHCPAFWAAAGNVTSVVRVKIIRVLRHGTSKVTTTCYHPDVTRYGWCDTAEGGWGFCLRSCQFRPGVNDGVWTDERQQRRLEKARFQTLRAGTSCYGGQVDFSRELCMAGRFASPQVATFQQNKDGSLVLTNKKVQGYDVRGYRDSCQGDSGSPVWKWVRVEVADASSAAPPAIFVGLVSRGVGCAGEDSIGVVTRVKQHLGWIADVTGIQNIDLEPYGEVESANGDNSRSVTADSETGSADRSAVLSGQLLVRLLTFATVLGRL